MYFSFSSYRELNMDMSVKTRPEEAAGISDRRRESEALIEGLFRSSPMSMRNRVDESCRRFFDSTDAADPEKIEEIQKKFMSFDIPAQGSPADAYCDMLDNDILPHCSHLASPRYLGHMTSPIPHFLPEIGRLIQTLNQNVVKMETSRGLTFLERQVIGMLHREIFRYDRGFYEQNLATVSSTLGIFTSGGTLANICALWTALRRSQLHGSPDALQAASGQKQPVIIGSELMHYSFDKGAELMGAELKKIPVDDHYRMDIHALKHAIKECRRAGKTIICLVAIAGTTDYGSVDDIRSVCNLARELDVHVHVDAAWGGGLILSERNRQILEGIELADTITIDGHKQLMLPIGCGILFFREAAFSQVTIHHAPYAVRATSFDQGRFTLEGTRPATALYLHAALHIIGKNGYDQLFSASLARANYMANSILLRPEFELIAAPTMNLLAYRYLPEKYRNKKLNERDNDQISRFNVALQKRQREKGDSFVSRTFRRVRRYDNQGLTLLRAVLLNPLSKVEDIDYLLNDQIQIAGEMERQGVADAK